MQRRSFLAGLLGLATATVVARVVGPTEAEAGVINPSDGILDELNAAPEAEAVQYGGREERRRRRRRRREREYRDYYRYRRRRRVVCRTYRRRRRRVEVCRVIRY